MKTGWINDLCWQRRQSLKGVSFWRRRVQRRRVEDHWQGKAEFFAAPNWTISRRRSVGWWIHFEFIDRFIPDGLVSTEINSAGSTIMLSICVLSFGRWVYIYQNEIDHECLWNFSWWYITKLSAELILFSTPSTHQPWAGAGWRLNSTK